MFAGRVRPEGLSLVEYVVELTQLPSFKDLMEVPFGKSQYFLASKTSFWFVILLLV